MNSSWDSSDDLDAVQVLDHLVQRAVALRASDIHVEPRREALRIRFRIDGVMVDQGSLPREVGPPLLTRVKVLGRMDMTERRLPQDGQFTLILGPEEGKLAPTEARRVVRDAPRPPQAAVGGKRSNVPVVAHLRASTFPAIHGETLVLRVLMGHELIPMDRLGMDDADLWTVQRLVTRPHGLIVVCGPTGSGKTSTLYSLLQQIDTAELSVVTLEDPIEVEFPHVIQGQTNQRQGFTFAAGLRAILRQDPDVIMVGEMRDAETAQIALQAALTGHLVLTTLHTSSAVETVARVVDLGVEPWIVANALLAVVAQRLVRRLCSSCAEGHELPNDLVSDDASERVLLSAGTKVKRPKGCADCHHTGFQGRTGIFEVLEADDDLRDLVKTRPTARSLRDHVRSLEMRTLREAGLARVARGETSLDEVLRVT